MFDVTFNGEGVEVDKRVTKDGEVCMTEEADADVLSELANKLFEMVQRDA